MKAPMEPSQQRKKSGNSGRGSRGRIAPGGRKTVGRSGKRNFRPREMAPHLGQCGLQWGFTDHGRAARAMALLGRSLRLPTTRRFRRAATRRGCLHRMALGGQPPSQAGHKKKDDESPRRHEANLMHAGRSGKGKSRLETHAGTSRFLVFGALPNFNLPR
jgi:hypothetical protein